MPLQNTKEKFGSLTKLLHWGIFLLFVLQYFLVYRREYFPKDSPEKLSYILLHKSIGVFLLLAALFMIVLRHTSERPAFPMNMRPIERLAAKSTHLLLYLMMFLQPISGILMSMFGGRKVSVFGWFDLPVIVSKNETLGDICYQTHVWCSYLIIALVILHALGSLYHHFIKQDNVFIRMLPG